jgi:hypothetical protein
MQYIVLYYYFFNIYIRITAVVKLVAFFVLKGSLGLFDYFAEIRKVKESVWIRWLSYRKMD